MPITRDHKPEDKEEKIRIMARGGVVRKDSEDVFYRVYQKGKLYPGLNMSRSIGDLFADNLGVIAEPEVNSIGLT